MPPGFSCAVITKRATGFFVFTAFAIGGRYCKEGFFYSLDEAKAAAAAFMDGKQSPSLHWMAY